MGKLRRRNEQEELLRETFLCHFCEKITKLGFFYMFDCALCSIPLKFSVFFAIWTFLAQINKSSEERGKKKNSPAEEE